MLAERKGFEPSIRVNVYALSRGAPSATRPPLRRLKPLEILDLRGKCRFSLIAVYDRLPGRVVQIGAGSG